MVFFASVWGGALCDRLGITLFTVLVSLCTFTTCSMLLVPNPVVQIIAQIDLTLGTSLYYIVITRYAMQYAEADLFGTFSGLLFTFAGFGLLFLSAIATTVTAIMTSKRGKYQIPFMVLGTVSSSLGLWLALWWWQNPPPSLGAKPSATGTDKKTDGPAVEAATAEGEAPPAAGDGAAEGGDAAMESVAEEEAAVETSTLLSRPRARPPAKAKMKKSKSFLGRMFAGSRP